MEKSRYMIPNFPLVQTATQKNNGNKSKKLGNKLN